MSFSQGGSVHKYSSILVFRILNGKFSFIHSRLLNSFLFSFLLVTSLFSQSPGQLKLLAPAAFESRHYREAASYYGRLLEIYPRDPRYQYFTAVSLLQSGTSYRRCVDLLSSATVQAQFPDAIYQAGEACRLGFRFHDAEGQYANVLALKGLDKDLREKLERAIKMNASARKEVQTIREVKVLERYECFASQKTFSSVRGDQLFRWALPEESYLARYRLLADSGVHMPEISYTDAGSPVFFAARTGKKADLNLYQAKKIAADKLGVPILLDFSLNSGSDEGFAWFDVLDSLLYFSSSGHNSMGGSDLFRSRLKANGAGWSTPENLGFPVNTPFDDLALVILPDRARALLISNRQSGGAELTAYLIQWPLLRDNREYTHPDSLFLLAQLPAMAAKGAVEGREKRTGTKQSVLEPVKKEQPAEASPAMEGTDDSQYMLLLNEALKMQLRADSFLRESEKSRDMLAGVSEPKERQRLQQEIRINSTLADQVQGQANSNYSRAREMELRYLQQIIPVKKLEQGGEEKNGSSRTSEGKGSKVPDRSVSGKEVKGVENNAAGNGGEPADSFAILAGAPYSVQNPIPVLLAMQDGVVYRIQLGVFSKTVAYDRFGALSPVVQEKVPENGMTRYYTGRFTRIERAEKALREVRDYGFKEAFVVSFFQGKKISLIRARELEQMLRTGSKP